MIESVTAATTSASNQEVQIERIIDAPQALAKRTGAQPSRLQMLDRLAQALDPPA